MPRLLVQQAQIVFAIIPVDSQTGANAGDWVNMAGYDRCTVLIGKAAGIAGDDPVLTMLQGKTAAGGTSKALNFTTIHAKIGAQTGIGTFTKVTQAAANTYTDLVSAEAQALWAIEFTADQLDVQNGYSYIQLSVPDTGAAGAQLLCAFYILRNSRFAGATMPSAIV